MADDLEQGRASTFFSLSSVEKVFNSVWNGQTSQEAKEVLRRGLDFHAHEIATKAAELCKVRGAKRISKEDVRIATEWYFDR